jgi:uncharacterized ubiquitin-like protein YukD
LIVALTDASTVGDYLTKDGFSSTSVPTDEVVNRLIEMTDKMVIQDVTYEHTHENVTDYVPLWSRDLDDDWGECNDVNTVFFIKNPPIADLDGIEDASTVDVTVDLYDYSADDWVKDVPVHSVEWKYGKITLVDAPSTDDEVYVDYRQYIAGEKPDADLMKWAATNACAAIIWQNAEADIVQLVESYSVSGIPSVGCP